MPRILAELEERREVVARNDGSVARLDQRLVERSGVMSSECEVYASAVGQVTHVLDKLGADSGLAIPSSARAFEPLGVCDTEWQLNSSRLMLFLLQEQLGSILSQQELRTVAVASKWKRLTRTFTDVTTEEQVSSRTEFVSISVDANLENGAGVWAAHCWATCPTIETQGALILPELVRTIEFKRQRYHRAQGRFRLTMKAGEGGVLLHEVLGHLVERPNEGVATSLINTQAMPPTIDVWDDPLMLDSIASYDLNANGLPAAATHVVESGQFVRGLGARSARQENAAHTPTPRQSNLCLIGSSSEPTFTGTEIRVLRFGKGSFNHTTGEFIVQVEEALLGDDRVSFEIRETNLAGFLRRLEVFGSPKSAQLFCAAKGGVLPVTVHHGTVRTGLVLCN